MSITKKIMLFLLALLTVFAMFACGNQDDEKEEPTEPTLNMGTPDCTHIWGDWQETVESTCTKKGTQVRSCTLCGKEEQKRTPATGHYYVDGYCSACGRNERACEHQTTERIVIKEATCTEYGQANIICTVCDAVLGVTEIAPAGHGELTRVVEIEATCVDDGYAKMVCTVCGGVEHAYTVYAEGHNDTEWVTIKEPTCTEEGHKQRVCHTCDKIIDEYFPSSLGHQDTEWVTVKEPTCTASGHKQDICKICNAVVRESYPSSTGHTNTEWITVKEPTCTEAGHKQQTCYTCNQVINESFPSARGHSYQYEDAKAPTCTETGWYQYAYCTVCDYTQLPEKARPANGHNNTGGLCNTCGAVDSTFVKTEVADIPKLEHVISKPSDHIFTAPAAQFLKKSIAIAEANESITFEYKAVYTGTYYFWISELYSGNSVKLYIRDYLGQNVKNDTNMVNEEGFYVELTAGQVYTVEVGTRTCAAPGVYFLNVAAQTATADISAYTAVQDSMSFKNQVNYYTFTPAVDGSYRLWFSGVVSGLTMDIYVYNDLNERVNYATGCGNNEGFNLNNMAAGKTYRIEVRYRSGQGSYTLNLGKQQATVDVSKFNTIQDNIYFTNQVNRYTFTVPSNGDYRIQLGNLAGSIQVKLNVYNSLGETVEYNSYAVNDSGFTLTNLAAGQTYTITVAYSNGSSAYTLYIFGQKPVVELTDNTGAVDSFEYKKQANTYTFTAKEGGTYRIAITGMVSGTNVTVYIYDANGSVIKSDSYITNGEYLTLTELVPGATYTIKVSCNGVLTEYTISVQ